jgi:hypothetical protein
MMYREFLGRRSRRGVGGHSTRSTRPEDTAPRAASGEGGAGLRRRLDGAELVAQVPALPAPQRHSPVEADAGEGRA